MDELYYGIDLHSTQITNHVICKNQKGKIIRMNEKIYINELDKLFLPKLNKNAVVCVEASGCTFNFVNKIKDKVKQVIVVNPIAFKNMYCTDKKNDKVDAKKLADRLKYYIECNDEEEDFPEVFMPNKEAMQMRKLFTTYNLLQKNIVTLKNRIHSIIKSNLIVYKKTGLFNNLERLNELIKDIDEVDKFQITLLLEQIKILEMQQEKVKINIYKIGYQKYENEIKLLLSIKGVSDFTACAIMADIVDIDRFRTYKKLCSYLRSTPKVDASNNSIRVGNISKRGRKLSYGLLLQGLVHIIKSSPSFTDFYDRKVKGKNRNTVRSAIVRKTIVAIFYILKNKEIYRDCEKKNYENKLKQFEKKRKLFSQTT